MALEGENQDITRKRKYMPLQFVPKAAEETFNREISNTFTPMSFKRAREHEEDQEDEEGEEDDDDAKTRFRPIGFTQTTPLVLNKATESEEEAPNEKVELSIRTKMNVFKGKKYGIGAQILKNMGYVEGKGLGKDGQGIITPIEQDLRKQGVGIGGGLLNQKTRKLDADEIDEDSSDEEYYRDVPKKSLFQIIIELERNGVVLPDKIKILSGSTITDSHKPFIELRKEGNRELEELTKKLDSLNNELNHILLEKRSQELQQIEIKKNLEAVNRKESLYQTLLTDIDGLVTIINDESLSSTLAKIDLISKEFQRIDTDQYRRLTTFDIDQIFISLLKPLITQAFESWNPLDITDMSLLDKLILLNQSIPSSNEIYGELSYFQSLIYTLWLPKLKSALENWPIDQPNVIISLLLDWNEIIDDRSIDYYSTNQIAPKVIKRIQSWDVRSKLENPPYVWIFEWTPYIQNSMNEVKSEFKKKYTEWLISLDLGNNDKVQGLHSLKEIIGDADFGNLIKETLIPKLASYYLQDQEIKFNNSDINLSKSMILFEWVDFIDSETFVKLIRHCFINFWLRSLYYSLKESKNYSIIANNLKKSLDILQPYIIEFKELQNGISQGFDMINELIDDGKLEKKHVSSLSKSTVLDLILTETCNKQDPGLNRVKETPVHKLEVTFKEVVEDYCVKHDLFVQALKNDLTSGHLLFKISRDSSGREGLISYIEEDVLFIRNGTDTFTPISLDDIANRV